LTLNLQGKIIDLREAKGATKMTKGKQYNIEYKVQAMKLAHEIGGQRVSEELGILQEHPVWMDAKRAAGCHRP